jgi:hypothetical protein
MKIWDVQGDFRKYAPLIQVDAVKNGIFFSTLPDFDGSKIGDSWTEIKVDFYDQESKPDQSNFNYLTPGVLVCDRIALTALRQDILTEVEVLPIHTPDKQLNLLNVTNIIDCLNKEETEKEGSFIGAEIIFGNKLAFDLSKLENVNLFKIPELVYLNVFATDMFKAKVEAAGLTGLKFELVYDQQ